MLDENSDITDNDLLKLKRMLGATIDIARKNWGYRNHFAAGGSDIIIMEKLLDAGLVYKGRKYNDTNYFYHATIAGCEAIGLTKTETKRALEDN
jgi:hypothetical protein